MARRIGIVYEATILGKEANIFKARNLYGEYCSRYGGHKWGGVSELPGEVSGFFSEKSAAAIVFSLTRGRRAKLRV